MHKLITHFLVKQERFVKLTIFTYSDILIFLIREKEKCAFNIFNHVMFFEVDLYLKKKFMHVSKAHPQYIFWVFGFDFNLPFKYKGPPLSTL